MENERGSWGSNLGFLMAAIGSAVGLGNIWGFPYKMGKSGGFAFLVVYVLLAIFVGFSIMMSELAMGRKTGKGTIGAYHALSARFKWVGWLAVFSPFVILSFYTVLGGYCIEYMSLNLSNLAFGGAEIKAGADLFGSMLTNPFGCVMFTFLFMIICYLINRGGISGGIEKFNNVGMPALFVMLVIIIIRSVTLPGAAEGLKFMFLPGYAVSHGYIAENPGFISVLATAGGQMFFSLSLAMGIMVTYGSYLHADEDLLKNSVVVVAADTIVALDGQVLGKPQDQGEAFAMLSALSGREHRVYTGVTVLGGGQAATEHEETAVAFRALSPEEIRDYIATGEPMDKAGAYGIQGVGALLVQGIRGDYCNVVGLPLFRLGRMLSGFGVKLPRP